MKQILAFLFLTIALTALGQTNQTVELRWKIGANEKLNYLTAMNEIGVSSFELNFDDFFKAFSDDDDGALEEGRQIIEKVNAIFDNQDFITTLTNDKKGIIDISVMIKPQEPSTVIDNDSTNSEEAAIAQVMQEMTGGVILRGSVYETGGIHSFWVNSNQKNLIAILFELPTKPVKVGDTWSLDINLISNDQNFICDTAYKINEVTLVEIKEMNNETVAVLKYNIIEYVKGEFKMPYFVEREDSPKETMMQFTLQGIANFSIERGRWVNYDGIMSITSTGVITTDKKIKYTLIDEKNADK